MLCLRQILFVLAPFWRITCSSQVNESLSPVDAKYLDLALFWRVTCCSQVNESLSPVNAKYLVLTLFWGITYCSQVNKSLSPVDASKEKENFIDNLAEVASSKLGGDFEDGVSGIFVEDQGSDLSQEIEWDNHQDGPSVLTSSSSFSYPRDLDIARRKSSKFFLEMPVKQPASIYQKFEEDVDLWNAEFSKYIQVQADGTQAMVITGVIAQNAKERYEVINELFKQIREADENHATNFPNLMQKRIGLNENKLITK